MAAPMRVAARMTKDEYLGLPETPGLRLELLDGEVVTMNSPLALHQAVALRLLVALSSWCDGDQDRGRVLHELAVDVGPDTVLVPDVQWYAAARALPVLTSRPWPVGDLVAEVLSASTARYDAEVKLARYFDAGACDVWLVDPVATTIRASTADGERTLGTGDTLTSPVLPGFGLPLALLRVT